MIREKVIRRRRSRPDSAGKLWGPANKRTGGQYTRGYAECVVDLIGHDSVQRMKQFRHHYNVTCFDHSLSVSYYSFLICRAMGWDSTAAARGGLLHDLFLYDWRTTELSCRRHAFVHPGVALENAGKICPLSHKEKDIVLKHMFPLTPRPPLYKESMVVCLVDKFCAAEEIIRKQSTNRARYSNPVKEALGVVEGGVC